MTARAHKTLTDLLMEDRERADRLPPQTRVLDHAADQLQSLLLDDAVTILVEASRDPAIRDAVANLLGVLSAATSRRPR